MVRRTPKRKGVRSSRAGDAAFRRQEGIVRGIFALKRKTISINCDVLETMRQWHGYGEIRRRRREGAGGSCASRLSKEGREVFREGVRGTNTIARAPEGQVEYKSHEIKNFIFYIDKKFKIRIMILRWFCAECV